MGERDRFLDSLRILAILWVLGVHILYWLGFFPAGPPAVAKSFLLLEMPLFFFISGAGNALSDTGRPWLRFVLDRWRRILIPYWCYALVCLLITAADRGGLDREVILSWLLPLGKPATGVPFLSGALWYVPVYLLCTAVFPLLRRLKKRFAVMGVLAALVCLFDALDWYYPQNAAFYSLWMLAGLYYPALKVQLEKREKRRFLLPALMCALALALLYAGGYITLDMQVNKFPPNGVFLIYSLMAMCLLALAAPGLTGFLHWLGRVRWLGLALDRLGRYSLTVFLYHPLAFLLLQLVNTALAGRGVPYSVLLLLDMPLLTAAAWLLTVVFGPVEILGKRRKA